MKRGCLSVVALRLMTIFCGMAALPASVLLVSPKVMSQAFINETQTNSLDQQLNVPLNNGLQGEPRERADFFLRLGGQAQRNGNLEKAIANWLQALDIYQRIGDLDGLGLTYNYLGVTYANLGRYREAEDALRRRLGVARTQQDLQGQIYALNNLGTVLLQGGNLQTARETFTEALEIARSVRNREGQGLSLSNLGLVAAGAGNYLEAIERYRTALTLRSVSSDPLGEANTRNNLGDAYRATNLPREALTSYYGALRVAQNSRDIPNQFRAFRGVTQSYIALGQYPPAFKVLDQYMALARQEKNPIEELFSLRLSAALNQAAGNLSNARDYYQKAIALADALGDTQQQALIRNDLAQILYERRSR